MTNNDRDYHHERARTEMGADCRAAHKAAADAHMRLSAMHMKRLNEQAGPAIAAVA
jgi:hypothetical protein